MKVPKLIVCGSIAVDRIMNFSGRYKDLIHADKMHVLSLSVLLEKLEDTQGGVGANIASSLAQLGEHPVLLGSVGNDATRYMERLKQLGVDTEHVHYSELATASFNVITDIDDNQVGGFYPGAMGDSTSLSLKPWSDQQVTVIVSAHDPSAMKMQVDECKRLGLKLVYDPGQQVSNVPAGDLTAGLDTAEVIIVNDYELGALSKKVGKTEAEIKELVPILITTLGKQGSVIDGSIVKSPIKIQASKPAQVIDPTGAGDAFRAGFLYGYLRQWELAKCGQLGSVVASFIVEKHGTQTELIKENIIKRYRDTFNEEIEL